MVCGSSMQYVLLIKFQQSVSTADSRQFNNALSTADSRQFINVIFYCWQQTVLQCLSTAGSRWFFYAYLLLIAGSSSMPTNCWQHLAGSLTMPYLLLIAGSSSMPTNCWQHLAGSSTMPYLLLIAGSSLMPYLLLIQQVVFQCLSIAGSTQQVVNNVIADVSPRYFINAYICCR